MTFSKAIGHTIQSSFFIRISRLISAKFEEYYLSKQEAEILTDIILCLENLLMKYNLYVLNLTYIIIPFSKPKN